MPTPVRTSRTRRWAVALGIGTCFLLAMSIPLIVIASDDRQISLANAAHLRRGMPKSEVLAILGPPRVETTRALAPLDEIEFMGAGGPDNPEVCHWISNACTITIVFDDESGPFNRRDLLRTEDVPQGAQQQPSPSPKVWSVEVSAPPFQNETWLDKALWRLRKSLR